MLFLKQNSVWSNIFFFHVWNNLNRIWSDFRHHLNIEAASFCSSLAKIWVVKWFGIRIIYTNLPELQFALCVYGVSIMSRRSLYIVCCLPCSYHAISANKKNILKSYSATIYTDKAKKTVVGFLDGDWQQKLVPNLIKANFSYTKP